MNKYTLRERVQGKLGSTWLSTDGHSLVVELSDVVRVSRPYGRYRLSSVEVREQQPGNEMARLRRRGR